MRFVPPFVLLLLAAVLAPAPSLNAAAAKALCLVCKVREGAVAEEAVVATRIHEGHEYGFCSEKCAAEFDADPAAYVPPTFPRSAPQFELRDLEGEPISNGSLAGRVVLLDFWATWCAPCRKSMPELQAMHERLSDRGLSVVGISIDTGGPAKVRKFVKAKRIGYRIAVDSDANPAWDAFRVKTVPAAFLLDRRGRIVAQWTGAPPDPRELERRVAELLTADAD